MRARGIGLLICAAFCCPGADVGTQIILDGHASGRTFDGIGAVSAGASSRLLIDYPEPYRSEVLDYLFKPNYGAALQHLKVEIGADVNSTDGSEPSHMRSKGDHDYTRGYEWWLMEEAHKRNPDIILDVLPWGAPGWVGNGTLYTADMARYVADFIQGAKKQYDLDIQYAGIWNEKEHDSEYVKELKRILTGEHLATKIVCCDEYPGEHQWRVATEIQHDAELASAIYVLSVHYPQTEDGALTTTHAARASGRPLWSSEDQPNSGAGPILSRDWEKGGRILASVYNRNYLEGSLTKTEIWSPVTSYYDNLAAPNSGLMYANTPWSGYYDVQSAIWVTAHTTQFAKPGWQYLDSACGYLKESGTYVSLKSPDGKDWTMVAETIGAKQPQAMRIQVSGGLSTGKVHIWETNAGKTFEHIGDADGAVLTVTLEPDSLYTLSTRLGQARGDAQPPVNTPFPLPYKDDFEHSALHRAAKFLADQDGAFEVQSCRERSGRCLEQVITEKPIPWGPLPDPFTMAGEADWTDYTVSSDLSFTGASAVTLMGRIDSADVFADQHARWPSGYVLRIEHDGHWELLSSKYKQAPQTLASGNLDRGLNGWHHAGLTFKGISIRAELDGKELTRVDNKAHSGGMFALGTDWGRAQFDNVDVSKE